MLLAEVTTTDSDSIASSLGSADLSTITSSEDKASLTPDFGELRSAMVQFRSTDTKPDSSRSSVPMGPMSVTPSMGPTGHWTGFFHETSGVLRLVTMILETSDSEVSGSGFDVLGRFLVQGKVIREEGVVRVHLRKQHSVKDDGVRSSEPSTRLDGVLFEDDPAHIDGRWAAELQSDTADLGSRSSTGWPLSQTFSLQRLSLDDFLSESHDWHRTDDHIFIKQALSPQNFHLHRLLAGIVPRRTRQNLHSHYVCDSCCRPLLAAHYLCLECRKFGSIRPFRLCPGCIFDSAETEDHRSHHNVVQLRRFVPIRHIGDLRHRAEGALRQGISLLDHDEAQCYLCHNGVTKPFWFCTTCKSRILQNSPQVKSLTPYCI